MKLILKPILALLVVLSATLSPLHAEISAVDDGSAGSPFLTTRADTPAVGGDVTANDTGASVSVVAGTLTTANGGTVDLRADGTFFFTPGGAAVKALDSGSSLTDTFDYMLAVTAVTAGVTFELDADAGSDNFTWGGKPGIVAATGTSIPAGITMAHNFTGTGATRLDFSGQGQATDYSLSSASFEFWIKADAVNTRQIIFETGTLTTFCLTCLGSQFAGFALFLHYFDTTFPI